MTQEIETQNTNANENVVLFYCKDCQKVDPNAIKQGNKYIYVCSVCGSDRVVFGSQKAICDFFNIKEGKLGKMNKDVY